MDQSPGPGGRGWLRRHDPDLYALHRAVRVTLVVVGVLVLTDLVFEVPQMIPFAVFGALALLLFTDFPGTTQARLTAYLMLAVTGAALLTLGTLLSRSLPAGAVGMAVVGVGVTFAGSLSAVLAAGGRAALLTFILPVTVPGTPADLPVRLGGWGLAAVLAIPAAMLMWPPRQHDRIRTAAAAACRAQAALLYRIAGPDRPTGPDAGAAMTALRTALRATTYRPVALTTGSRLLLRVVDELEWLHGLHGLRGLRASTRSADAGGGAARPAWARAVCRSGGAVLDAAAEALPRDGGVPDPAARDRLDTALRKLATTRRRAADDFLHGAPGDSGDRLRQVHGWAYAAELIGGTVRAAAAADARPLRDRLFGRPAADVPLPISGPLAAAERLTRAGARRHSVWWHNSLRTGLGLGLAVLLAGLLHMEHGFWVVLGAMSVLRTSAVTTTATAGRAMAGTLVGFVLGAAIVVAVGAQGTPALWVVLPLCVLLVGFAPETISFAAGQAAFTLTVLVLFNIISPAGWQVGLIRIEDVALGCGAGLLVGLLMWPRGGEVELRTSLGEAYQTGARALGSALDGGTDLTAAKAAGHRLDAALRQYLAEGQASEESRAAATSAVTGAIRLRLTAEAIVDAGAPAAGAPPEITGPLQTATAAVADWYATFGNALLTAGPVPAPPTVRTADPVIDWLRFHPEPGVGAADPALPLLEAALYVDDAAELASRVVPAGGALVIAPQRRSAGR